MENEVVNKNYQNKFLLSTPLYTDFAGGLNTRVSPPQMAINQSILAENCIYNVASGAVSARYGTVRHLPTHVPLHYLASPIGFFQARYSGGYKWICIGFKPDGGFMRPSEYTAHFWDDTLATPAWVAVTGLPTGVTCPASHRIVGTLFNDALIFFDGVNEPFALTLSGSTVVYTQLFSGGAPALFKEAEFSAVYNNRLYVGSSKSSALSWSDEIPAGTTPGVLPSFTADNTIYPGGLSDGDPGTGLTTAYGHLIVFKRNSIYAVSDSSGNPSVTPVSRGIGCIAKSSFCQVDNSVWFFGPSGLYALSSDLTPEFQSDFVLPDYQSIMTGFAIGNDDYWQNVSNNYPVLAYNQNKQQIWCVCYKPGASLAPQFVGPGEYEVPHNIVYIHDTLNKDSSGRPAISVYKFYIDHTDRCYQKNMTPMFLVEGWDIDTNSPNLFSLCRHKYPTSWVGDDYGLHASYVYKHDVSIDDGSNGDDGHAVDWQWQSKYFNLGDPLRLKVLRYYSIFGDILDDAVADFSERFFSYQAGLPDDGSLPFAFLEDFPVAIKAATVVRVDPDYIVVFGGQLASGAYSRDIYYCAPALSIPWTLATAKMPAAGHAYGAACYNYTDGKIYIFGGATNLATSTSAIMTFVATELFAGTATAPTVLTATMATARSHHSLGFDKANQNVYLFGTYAIPAVSLNIFESFNLTSKTSTVLTSPTIRTNSRGSSMVFRATTNILDLFIGNVEQTYSPVSGTWTPAAGTVGPSLGDYLYRSLFYIGDTTLSHLYLCGGEEYQADGSDGEPIDDVYHRDYSMGAFETVSSLPFPHSRMGVACYDDRVYGDPYFGYAYFVGGRNAPIHASFVASDNFTAFTTAEVNILLNSRQIVPPTVSFASRFWSIVLSGSINDGVSRITGFNFDYVMLQRRN